ncbi:MAG: succinate dehydrogenase [Gammaproteobacteria bacterium]|nr:succinate dehydrogenase [Gammaproteobacteria bacterium]
MVVHLAVNASVINGPATFQKNVYQIHSLGAVLPAVEWAFIFLPIIFHAVVGVVIVAGGLPNQNQYQYAANWRYSLQRWTGIIAFFFIMWHVLHMHGWFHGDVWLRNVAEPLGGAKFRPYNASSTAGLALQGTVYVILYAIGVLACVYHLANGIWTMGITWGVWTSERAQARALKACAMFGLLLAAVGLSSLWGMRKVGQGEALEQAISIEERLYQHKVEIGELQPNDHKRSGQKSHVEDKDNLAHATP